MNYLLLILFCLFLIIAGTIAWLLVLKRKYKKIQKKEIEKEEREILPEKETIKIKIKEEKEETKELPEKKITSQTADEMINLSDGLFIKISESFKKKLEETFVQEIGKSSLDFKEKINQTINEVLEGYKSHFEGINNEVKKAFSEQLVQILSQELLNKFDTFFKEVDEKIEQSYQPLQKSLKEKIEKTEKEIEFYKEKRLKEIDEKIYEIVKEVLERTGVKLIDMTSHEELIMAALEKAKAEKLFFEGK